VNQRNLKGKSVLITGGAGFVGSHLVDRIIKEEPEKIVIVSNFFLGNIDNLSEAKSKFPNLIIIRADVADYEEIEEAIVENNIDVVFNLAVIPLPTSLVKPEWTIKKNIDMTINVCKLLRLKKFETLIQYSSSEAAGSLKSFPMDESHVTEPETPYAASKAATDHIALSYHKTFGCDVTIIRPFNQYGPRQNAKKYAGIIPLTIGRMMRGDEVIIFGDGNQTRDFCFVRDTVEGTIEVYNNTDIIGQIINIASGKEVSMNELVKQIAKEMNYTKPILYKEARQGDVARHCADIEKAKKLCRWESETSFEDGIKETVSWYVQHPERF
jgi:UDP-glucose 4-epimerase